MPERGDSLVEAFNIWKESGEDAACCDFALAVAVPQIDDQTRCAFIIIIIIIIIIMIVIIIIIDMIAFAITIITITIIIITIIALTVGRCSWGDG